MINHVIDEIKINIKTDSYKLFYVYTLEEQKAVQIVSEIAKQLSQKVYHYDIASGLVCSDDKRVKNLPDETKKDLGSVLKWLEANGSGFVVFKDINPILETDPVMLRAFKNFLTAISEKHIYLKIFIVSSTSNIPSGIQHDAFFIDIPLPSRQEIEHALNQFAMMIGQRMDEELKEEFINSLQGMREEDIIKTLKYCLHDGRLIQEDLKLIIKVKKQIIKKESLIEIVDTNSGIGDVGGMTKLKEWLERKGAIIKNLDRAISSYVDIPKGVLIFGMPGCGKSLISKAIAYEWKLPLLRLDMGLILGPYIGQSEENIRKAIKIAESISPCILWIDELEKGFSGIKDDSGGGVMRRVFGSFLTWMQEKTKPVFVVATANDIGDMPPEFLRKGRFDEIFFVDFPNKEARKQILKIHLEKRKIGQWYSVLEKYADRMEGYAGSDIEAVVSELVERKFLANLKGQEIDPEKEIESIIKEFKPLSKTMQEQIKGFREKLDKISAKSVD